MTDAGHDLNADGELADRVHDLIRQDATGDATHLLREILFDLHRGRRQIDRATAGRLATAATQLGMHSVALSPSSTPTTSCRRDPT